jgi:hypothetical protein
MLWTLIVILIVLWVIGLALKVTTGLIHLLLIAAVILFIVRLFTGRRVA